MAKSQKELAFLRDLYIAGEWTERFTALADKNISLPEKGSFLFFNADTGNYSLTLRDKLSKDVKLVCVFENEELRKIAEAKAEAMKADIIFADAKELKSEEFDCILADLSFTPPEKIGENLDELFYLAKKGGDVYFFAPTAGSFGEIYSYLWESFSQINKAEEGLQIENLISRIPTVSDLEEKAADAGFKKIESKTSREVFEYDKAKDFSDSSFAADFLFPDWFFSVDEKARQTIIEKFAQTAEADLEGLSFRFSVKATLISGKKP